jgi:Tfp pilus assembly major pilin PilA
MLVAVPAVLISKLELWIMKLCNIIKASPAQERGIALLEALISLIIITIACAGSLYVVSRANVTKTEMSMQHITVHTLQQKLSNHHAINNNACAPTWHVNLPGVAQGHRPAVDAQEGCVNAVAGQEVQVGGTPIPDMPGRIILMAVDGNNMVGGNIVVGGS